MPVTAAMIDSDQAAIADFMNNDESTMTQVLSKSVGKVLLELRSIYPTGKDFDKTYTYKTFSTTLARNLTKGLASSGTTTDSIKSVTESILNIAKQPPTNLDKVTLYLSDNDDDLESTHKIYREKQYIFELKEVLWLVWQATQDHERFVQNYAGTSEEKLAQAKADYPKRLFSFYQCLDRIKNGICHHGVRNELVMTLNHIYGIGKKTKDEYQSIYIIEVPTTEANQFIKEKLNDKFWQRFQQSHEDKQQLSAALFQWISTENPHEILRILDPQDTIRTELYAHFKLHGNNPATTVCGKDLLLPAVVDRACQSLQFATDTQHFPLLAKLAEILSDIPYKDEPLRTQAVSKMQQWIKQQFHFGNAAEEAQVNAFHAHFDAYVNFHKHQQTLSVTGSMTSDTLKRWSDHFDQYFSAFSDAENPPPVSDATLQSLRTLHDDIEKAKNNGLVGPIEQFFVNWSSAHEKAVIEFKKKLYSILLHQQDKIKLDDDTLQSLTQQNSPYVINRILIHGIITGPQNWTPRFAEYFRRSLDLISTYPKSGDLPSELKLATYQPFIFQLNYRWKMYLYLTDAEQHKKPNIRPKNFILLPQQVQSAREWQRVSELLNESELETTYVPLSVWINKLLIDYLNANTAYDDDDNDKDDDKHVLDILKSLPEPRREPFIKLHWGLINQCVHRGTDVIDLLTVISPARRKSFLKANEKKFLAKIADGYDLANLLLLLEEKERAPFFNKHRSHFLPLIDDGSELAECLFALPPAERERVFLANESVLLSKINNAEELADCLDALPNNDAYFIKNESRLIHFIWNGLDLATVLNVMPKIDKIAFFRARESSLLPKIRDGQHLAAFLTLLPPTVALAFFHEYQASLLPKLQTGWDWHHLARVFTEDQLQNLFTTYRTELLDKLKTIVDIRLLLNALPPHQQETFISEHETMILAKIHDGNDIAELLCLLPETGRESYFVAHEHAFLPKITTGVQVALILAIWPKASRVACLTKHEALFLSLFKNGSELSQLLDTLPETTSVDDYFNAHAAQFLPLIKSAKDVVDILNSWPERKRKTFFISHEQLFLPLISNRAHLIDLLNTLPESARIGFFKKYSGVLMPFIKNGDDLSQLLGAFPIGKRKRVFQACANPFIPLIQNGSELAEVLEKFEKTERLDIFLAHESLLVQKIKSIEGLHHVLNELPINFRLFIINRHKQYFLSKINDAEDISLFLDVIPKSHRSAFFAKKAKLFWAKIRDGYDLACVIEALAENDVDEFIQQYLAACLSKLKTADDIIDLFTALDPTQIERLLSQHAERLLPKITDGYELSLLLDHIPYEDRVAFFEANKETFLGKIKSNTDFTYVLASVPYDSRQRFFADYESHFLPLIASASDLLPIWNLLPSENVKDFFTGYRDRFKRLLKSGSDWCALITNLPEETLSSFYLEYEAAILPKIKDGHELAQLFSFIPEEKRLAYFASHAALFLRKIHGGHQLMKLIRVMPEGEAIAFFKSHESVFLPKIKSGFEVADYITLWPKEARLDAFEARKDTLLPKFKTGEEWATLMSTFPDKDIITCFDAHKNAILSKITCGSDLAACLITLPPEHRLTLLLDQAEFMALPFRTGREIADVYGAIIACDRTGNETRVAAFEAQLLSTIRNGKMLEAFLGTLQKSDREESFIKHGAILFPRIDSLDTLYTISRELLNNDAFILTAVNRMPLSFVKNLDFEAQRQYGDHECGGEISATIKQIQQFVLHPAKNYLQTPLELMGWLNQTLQPPLPLIMGHADWLKLLEQVLEAAVYEGDSETIDRLHAMQVCVRHSFSISAACTSPAENHAALLLAAISIDDIESLPANYHELLAAALWNQPVTAIKETSLQHLLHAVQKGYRHLAPVLTQRQAELDALAASQEEAMEPASKRMRSAGNQGLFGRPSNRRKLESTVNESNEPDKETSKRVKHGS